ncbi:hypothetical protein MADA3029_790002 [Vibrio nigripulchritudo MADA3029]|nr:hypothetical protein VIBNIMADA3021_280026 [Vibrio nigripulchritudo MADA3021]CCN61428.1 hypothetical protein MADA3029_790002 [Vibrio nigripulchritudo MADA3029]
MIHNISFHSLARKKTFINTTVKQQIKVRGSEELIKKPKIIKSKFILFK